ncbi:uncharacterized protein LOC128504037 isoform X2 [Spea bombifrons]|uniref:uncharacterized protein LOC128504037 isoform X2 n=1 Tax=Spea bombifrons TaxID=233779 RepID=UPI00234BE568|nr:uncharacterized protein LOC128504037 isoform X2 [Spea bombifrons]
METAATRLLDAVTGALAVDEAHREDGDGDVSARVLVDSCKAHCRKQKMLCGQLQVLHFLLEFLEEADTANWDEAAPEILSHKLEEVKRHWKLLKAQYQEKVREVEGIIPQLVDRQQLLREKQKLLEESLQRYQRQKEETNSVLQKRTEQEAERLQDFAQRQRQVVQKCAIQIHQLEEEVKRLEESASSWVQTVSRLLTALQGFSVVSVEENTLVLDVDETTDVPLRLTLRWSPQGGLQVETDGLVPAPPCELLAGSVSHVKSVILELQAWYRSQGHVLRELSGLQDRFAVDWLPAERTLLFLKGSTQCLLFVEPGYPATGGIQLKSVKSGRLSLDPATLKPPGEEPSLCDWLEYLQSCPGIGQ